MRRHPTTKHQAGTATIRTQQPAERPARRAAITWAARTSATSAPLTKNIGKAIIWYYRAAADRNYAPAQYNLALAYAEAHGTPTDWIAAARWYHRAAEQGLVPAMINLAILYEKGDGVSRSLPDAYAWYRAAGERGDPAGAKRASELFGQFPDADRKRAESLFTETVATIRPVQAEPLAPSRPAATGGTTPPPVLKTGGGAPYYRG